MCNGGHDDDEGDWKAFNRSDDDHDDDVVLGSDTIHLSCTMWRLTPKSCTG